MLGVMGQAVLAATTGPSSGWWLAFFAFGTAALKALDRVVDSAKFRLNMAKHLGALEQKDREQQILLDQQRERIGTLQKEALEAALDLYLQRTLKHECLNRLNAMALVVALYRKLHGQDGGDTIDLDEVYRFIKQSKYAPAAVATDGPQLKPEGQASK